jgi:hypothetical protein
MKKLMREKFMPLFLAMVMMFGLSIGSGAISLDDNKIVNDLIIDRYIPDIKDIDLDKAETISIEGSPLDREAEELASKSASTNNTTRNQVYYDEFEGYIHSQGGIAATPNFVVFHGEVLQVRMMSPNNANIDYDLLLFESDASGNLIAQVDICGYVTRINPGYGTMPEAVGVYNSSGVTKRYRAVVISYTGFSSTEPFRLHVGIAVTGDTTEAFQNARNPQRRFLNTQSSTSFSGRIVTYADDDWYITNIPTAANYNTINVTLDANSLAAGYRVQIVTFNAGAAIVQSQPFTTTRGLDFFIRVTAESATTLTGANYTVTVTPVPNNPPNPPPGNNTNSFSRPTGTMNALTLGFSRMFPASSGTVLGTNPQVTSTSVRLVVSAGSSPVNLWVLSPRGTLTFNGTYGVGTHNNISFPIFNGENPQGTWYVWIQTTGALSTATATITVNYRW